MTEISGFHAHIYFDEGAYDLAEKLCHEAGKKFSLSVGRMHKKLVGPHPCWSCQLAFKPDVFGELIPWLAVNRNGLTVFIHPETGNDLRDHTEYAIWLGKVETLDLSIFQE